MELYGYYRSSAAYRVRIALNLKRLTYEQVAINLLQNEQQSEVYRLINPQGLVPSLKTDDDNILTQSPAILEWLEESYPEPPLLPQNALDKAKVRSWCFQVACDIHPICNLRILNYVKDNLNAGEEGKTAWLHHWMSEGFRALELQLKTERGVYCFGDWVTLADVYLIPQVFNALRFGVDMEAYPRIMSIYQACNELAAFERAQPERNKPAS
ncbi:maleylacetoacetate isomerase [Pseudomaricurvus sp.]|uniref:maleylacetoacetate isomerase n=1 Tax=Pseudomaricurvus sp. TaxID=2004510 RepID=UPI003F6A5584